MRHFSTSIDIAASTDRVYDVMSDVERWQEWTQSITSVQRLDSGPFVVGSRAMIRQPKFPPAVWKVTAILPGKSFTWESVAPGIRTVGHHSVEATPSGSRATLTVDISGALGGVLGWVTKDITQRYIDFEAQGLKARSENPAFRRAS